MGFAPEGDVTGETRYPVSSSFWQARQESNLWPLPQRATLSAEQTLRLMRSYHAQQGQSRIEHDKACADFNLAARSLRGRPGRCEDDEGKLFNVSRIPSRGCRPILERHLVTRGLTKI
jgi:hypothetical protein